jgi:esterase/lipase
VIDGAIVGKASVEALSLFHTLIKMIETAEKEGEALSLEQVIAALPPKALKLATNYVEELKAVRSEFETAFKSNPKELDKTLAELQSQTWWWRQKRYKLLRNFSPTVDAVKTSINTMLADVVALANCKEKDQLVAESYAKAEQIKGELAKRGDVSKLSVREILDHLVEDAEKMRDHLAKMVLRRS